MASSGTSNGLSPRIDAARKALGIVLPGETEAASLVPAPKYSRLAYANAGTSPEGNTRFNFFQSAYAAQTSNLRQPGKLTQNGLFICRGLGFDFTTATDNQADDDLTAFDIAESIRKILHAGYIRFEKNGRLILEDYGLHKYPSGGGIHAALATTTTATTTSQSGGICTNGVPDVRNRFQFSAPIIFTPNDVADFIVDFGTAIALGGTAVGTLMATLWGDEIVDSDR